MDRKTPLKREESLVAARKHPTGRKETIKNANASSQIKKNLLRICRGGECLC